MTLDELTEVMDRLLHPETKEGIKKALRLDDFSRWEDDSVCPGCSDSHSDRRCCRCGNAEHVASSC